MIIKGWFCLFLHKNICCGYSLESPQWGDSNEYPQHMVMENWWKLSFNYHQIPILSVPLLVLIKEFMLLYIHCVSYEITNFGKTQRVLKDHPHLHPENAYEIANSVDPDQTALGLHCLPRLICSKTLDHYATFVTSFWRLSKWECLEWLRKMVIFVWHVVYMYSSSLACISALFSSHTAATFYCKYSTALSCKSYCFYCFV